MVNTTLCYITRGDEVLMLHRVKKEKDINKDNGSAWAENLRQWKALTNVCCGKSMRKQV